MKNHLLNLLDMVMSDVEKAKKGFKPAKKLLIKRTHFDFVSFASFSLCTSVFMHTIKYAPVTVMNNL